MRFGVRRLALACLVMVGAIVVMVPGGSAGNREDSTEQFFDAVPGPGAVTYDENIAYRATFTNTGNSTFTHVVFRMRVPFVAASGSQPYVEATPVDDTCPSTPVTINTVNGPEWTCDLGMLGPGTAGEAQLVLTSVWRVPALTLAGDCPGCLVTNGRWTIKEGLNDGSDLNDAFPPGGIPVAATLLSAESETLDSTDTTLAGGYEIEACTSPLAEGSLRTKPSLNASSNPVSTTVCLPTIPSNATDLGLATTIVEGPLQPGNPGHAALGRSDVCVATLGTNCGVFGDYTPQLFDADHPITVVLRFADGALERNQTITRVWHNYDALTNPDPLPLCTPPNPVPLNGCLVQPPDRSNGRDKVWTAIVKTLTNGWFTGG